MIRSKTLLKIVAIFQVLDFCLTYYFVHYTKLATEKNPLTTSVYGLILAKVLFLGLFYLFYRDYKDKQVNAFNVASWTIIFSYAVALTVSVISVI